MEFAPRDTLPAVTGMRGGGRFGLEAGQWTDDTSMALCLARSLIETGTFDLRDQAEQGANKPVTVHLRRSLVRAGLLP